MEDIEAFAGVHLGPGTLYGAIARLETQGLIEPLEAYERRRPYRLTAAGIAFLHTTILWRRPGPTASWVSLLTSS